MRKELPPVMLLVDVVLRTNLFPLQDRVQRRGAILEALFRISEGYYFGPHHLIMVVSSILRRRCISGVLRGRLPFNYFSLGCYAMFWHMWVFLQTLSLSPAAIVERASL